MLIFLYGQDSYRSWQKLNEIIEHHQKAHKSGLSLRYLEGEEVNFQDFKNEVLTSPMFKEKKLVVLSDSFRSHQFKKEFLKEKKVFEETKNIIVFYERGLPRKDDPLFKFLKEESKSQEFTILKGRKLEDWAKKEFDKHGAQISPPALKVLVDSVGGDLYRFSSEIGKLLAFKGALFETSAKKPSVDRKVEVKDVEFLVKPKIETDIFKTIDALASGNKKQALSLFHKHLQNGDSPFYLFAMIAFQFRNLLMVKDLIEKGYSFGAILKKTNLHPYVLKKSFSYAGNFTLEELKKTYLKLFEIDLKIKKGRIAPELALDLLISET